MARFCPMYNYGQRNGIYYYYGQVCEQCLFTGAQDEVQHTVGGACQACGGPVGGCPDPIINPGPGLGKLNAGDRATAGVVASNLIGKDLKARGLTQFAKSAPVAHEFVGNSANPPQVTDLGNIVYQDSAGGSRYARLLRLAVLVTLPKANPGDPDVTMPLSMTVGQERSGPSVDAANPDRPARLHHYDALYSRRYHQVKLDTCSCHVLLHKTKPDADEEE